MISISYRASKGLAFALFIAICADALARAQDIYLSDVNNNTVGEYDATTGAPVAGWTSPAGLSAPLGLTISGNTLYVANDGNGTVDAYEATTGAPVAGFTPITVASSTLDFLGVAVSDNTLYLGYTIGPTVEAYNATTGAPTAGFTSPNVSEPEGLAISGNTLYVANLGFGNVGAYNITTGAPIVGFNPPSASGPTGVAVSGNNLYVVNAYGDTVTAFDATTGAPLAGFTTITGLNFPFGVAVTGNDLYVVNTGTGGPVGEYDATTGAAIAGFTSPSGLSRPVGIAISEPESVPNPIWVTNGIGDWNSIANWSTNTVPNGIGQEADFFDVITANHTIVDDSPTPITVGTLHFNNPNTYVIAGAGSLVIQANAGYSGLIQVDQGTQEIDLPLTIASNTTFNVVGGATLLIANPITLNSGVAVTQTGGGTVTYQSIITLQAGASLAFANSTTANTLTLQSGSSAKIAADTKSELQLYNLNLGTGATLDVTSNVVAVNYTGSSPLPALTAEVASGYDHGLWDGSGITSSLAAANPDHATTLGIFDTGSQVLIEYTWVGDANLDGVVNAADLAAMFSTGTTWQTGDFNYDGVVNADDYALFMLGATEQTGSFPPVPEPGIAAALGGLCLLGRRRKRI